MINVASFHARVGRAFCTFAIVILAALTGGCAMIDDVITPVFMMSPSDEIEFGAKVQTEVEKDLVFVEDEAVVGYIRSIGEKVVANAPVAASVPTQFFVVDDETINAFAIPGGNMYVHTGLIMAAEDEAELASVMAHEFGHVVYRHGAKHVSRAVGIGMMQQVLLGEGANAGAELVTDLVASGVITSYGRQDELEADSIAVPTLNNAGYDPAAMASFFQKLIDQYGDRSGMATWFSSHPATSERIARVNALVENLPRGGARERPVTELRRIQRRLNPPLP